MTFAKGVYVCGKPKEFRVGSRVLIETNVYMILDDARLLIGDDVRLYPFVYISGGKNLVEIRNHTHFAPGCVIYGQGNSVVLEDTEPNGFYAGAPAMRKRNLDS